MAKRTDPSADARRRLPSVDRLLTHPRLQMLAVTQGHAMIVDAAREIIAAERARREAGAPTVSLDGLADAVADHITTLTSGTLQPVINATGVIIHTNLGRAPLSQTAVAAMAQIAGGYSNLEYDLAEGQRGSRYVHADELLCRLTGSEAALVVNNNAGAVFLALSVLARDREVVISRGQLVEIGGGFRIPDVLRQSGARLVEVGTTNRTHLGDFAAAIGANTALLMRAHTSNFLQLGFTASVPLGDMVTLGAEHGVEVLDDLGSGTLLDTARFGLTPEPTVQQSVSTGAALVTFSGDKLLGGPQAGLIVGRRQSVARLREHPLTRALRVDKCTLAALQATLLHYLRNEAVEQIPVWRMIAANVDQLKERAEGWARRLNESGIASTIVPAFSTVGGGSLPGEELPTRALAIEVPQANALAAGLRVGSPPVIARIADGRVLLDPRTVLPEEDDRLCDAVLAAWARGAWPVSAES